ncbi:gem-associated protein 6 isoform X2 [Ornithorhynchus anatinus]|nr:gem-associated protein 6 isoform X2 [Ornithorhynchus anatinus]XP_028928470.1 gem-associated protein 6 isoform X2 [Ornithorhynchus anatinus]XP_028928477.1 gem-associated protein 6 isoform X2 [Ornithorhynchus anatinus]
MAFAKIEPGSDDEDNFEDAFENIPVATTMDLSTALEESTVALCLFLNNRFSDALNFLRPWYKRSMYHATGYGFILVLRALMTFETQDIQQGIEIMKEAMKTCQSFRRKSSLVQTLSHIIFKPNMESIGEVELHAEICYAECLLLKAGLALIEDETMLSFIKGGVSFGTSYHIYRDCQEAILKIKSFHQTKAFKHLERGVKFGIGAFNLLLSLLPESALRLLNFVGYTGDRDLGLALLHQGAVGTSVRAIMCILTLQIYYNYLCLIFGVETNDFHSLEDLLTPYLTKFPKCAILTFYASRIEIMKGFFGTAQARLQECILLQDEWREIHHLCYWELMWTYIFEQDWHYAYHYVDLLHQHNKWSKSMFTFLKASILCMLPGDFATAMGEDVKSLFMQVRTQKQKIGGKTPPTDKFADVKCRRYYSTTSWHVAQPILEMMYIWSGFQVIAKRLDLVARWMQVIETEEEVLHERPNLEYFMDDQCLVKLLKGCCLKYLDRLWKAELCFDHVIQNEKLLKFDHYLVPYAYYELGILFHQKGDDEKALTYIEHAKTYRDFAMESRLQFRVHTALQRICGNLAKDVNPDF